MKPTAIAKKVFYTPPCEPCDLTLAPGQVHPTTEQNVYMLSMREPKYHDKWHIEMEGDIDDHKSTFVLGWSFNSEDEAKGFMAGWNAHRSAVMEALYRKSLKRSR